MFLDRFDVLLHCWYLTQLKNIRVDCKLGLVVLELILHIFLCCSWLDPKAAFHFAVTFCPLPPNVFMFYHYFTNVQVFIGGGSGPYMCNIKKKYTLCV